MDSCIEIPGGEGEQAAVYELTRQLVSGGSCAVFRAREQADGQLVLLKLLKSEYPSPRELGVFRREFGLLKELRLAGVPRVRRLENYHNTLFMVLDDFEGATLAEHLGARRLELVEFLRLAGNLADILSDIHAEDIVVRGLSNSSILWNPETGAVRLIDFARSSVCRSGVLMADSELSSVEPLYYIAPEQTGRVNRAVDFRVDLYALGICFYEMLLGTTPFRSDDPAAIIYGHIATEAPLVSQQDPGVPAQVGEIIAKLLSKDPALRYQSAAGLSADLARCRACLAGQGGSGPIAAFVLGQDDVSHRFLLPQSLVGRKEELALLNELAQRAMEGEAPVVLVRGAAGVGKSALVQELRHQLAASQVLFAEARCEQRTEAGPRFGLAQLVRGLATVLLSMPLEELRQWRGRIEEAVGANAGLLLEMAPSLERVIGHHAPPPGLAFLETQNRLILVVSAFLRLFQRRELPLLLFVDDLQQADLPTLWLLEHLLLDGGNHHFMFVGTLRDGQRQDNAPLHLTLETIASAPSGFETITLAPLDSEQVGLLVQECFRCEVQQARALAGILHTHTRGNPYFVREFIRSLFDQAVVRFDATARRWVWDPAQVAREELPESVAELVTQRVAALPPLALRVLQPASCVGSSFAPALVADVSELDQAAIQQRLLLAVEHGLLVRGLAEDRGADEGPATPGQHEHELHFSFSHERIRQEVYEGIDSGSRSELHLRLGRALLRRDGTAFEAADHLNKAAELLEPGEIQQLADLNRSAGRKAKAAAAFDAAYAYYGACLELMGPQQWERDYQRCLAVHVEAAEAAYLATEFDFMQQLVDEVIRKGRSLVDAIPAYEISLHAQIAENKLVDAIETARSVLARLGIRLPAQPGRAQAVAAIAGTQLRLAGKDLGALAQRPAMKNENPLAAMRILGPAASAAFMARPMLSPIMICRMVTLTLKHGNAPESDFAFCGFGLFLCAHLGAIEQGYRIGELSLRLQERFGSAANQGKLFYVFNTFIRHFKEHIAATYEPALEAIRKALEVGDFQYAGLCIAYYTATPYYLGWNLAELEDDTARYSALIHRLRQRTTFVHVQMLRQVVANLRGDSEEPYLLRGEHFDEERMIPALEEEQYRTALCFCAIHKLFLAYLFGRPDQARIFAERAAEHISSIPGMIVLVLYNFYDALTCLRLAGDVEPRERRQLVDRAVSHQRRLKKWAGHAPANYLHKWTLVEAERARVLGEPCRDLYDSAIEQAARNGYVRDEALANECAAGFHFSQERPHLARHYLREALHAYLRWGALAKVRSLRKQYPLLGATSETPLELSGAGQPQDAGRGASWSRFDTDSVFKVARAIAGEMDLSTLLERALRILIRNAGAQRGLLLLERDGRWTIAAEGRAERQEVTLLDQEDMEPSEPGVTPRLSTALVYAVSRTRRAINLHDAQGEGRFPGCRYIREAAPKSLLGVPILHQSELLGVIYLENNLTKGAFTTQHLEILSLLSAQIAVSLRNATLYHDLEQSLERQIRLTNAYSRFVPREFLEQLGKGSILDVNLGDTVRREMTVLFSDIRSFTSISEQLSPEENFRFLNTYLELMTPTVRSHYGFVDKYIGDAIMALFPRSADHALGAAIEMLRRLRRLNQARREQAQPEMRIGIGVNTGQLMLGTIGGGNRMEATVISDAVNVASRLESLTKHHGVALLISEDTHRALRDRQRYSMRSLGRASFKGKEEQANIYEVFDADPPQLRKGKLATREDFEEGCRQLRIGDRRAAGVRFARCVEQVPGDVCAVRMLADCED